MLSWKKIYKNLWHVDFSSFSGTLVRFSIQTDDLGFDFYEISLSDIV